MGDRDSGVTHTPVMEVTSAVGESALLEANLAPPRGSEQTSAFPTPRTQDMKLSAVARPTSWAEGRGPAAMGFTKERITVRARVGVWTGPPPPDMVLEVGAEKWGGRLSQQAGSVGAKREGGPA